MIHHGVIEIKRNMVEILEKYWRDIMSNSPRLVPPCSYQGGKVRLAKKIVDIILADNEVDENTKFFDLCCGSGAITLELINRGIHPTNIVMVDIGLYGLFWNTVANEEFELDVFRKELNKLPSIENIQKYLQNLSNEPVNEELKVYHYLMLQAGSFGSKQIWIEGDEWKNNSFRSYWKPTATSKRRSPVNPMMPMPDTLFSRVEDIVNSLSGCINAIHSDIFQVLYLFDNLNNAIIYIDPPYQGTTSYKYSVDIYKFIESINNEIPIYVSEGMPLQGSNSSYLLSKGRNKGNISGNRKKQPTEEWLNLFMRE